MQATTSRKTQTNIVRDHLRKHGSITQLEALGVYKITRLAARIEELRDRGLTIRTDMRTDETGARYARYCLSHYR